MQLDSWIMICLSYASPIFVLDALGNRDSRNSKNREGGGILEIWCVNSQKLQLTITLSLRIDRRLLSLEFSDLCGGRSECRPCNVENMDDGQIRKVGRQGAW
jgi:hypothetical protein